MSFELILPFLRPIEPLLLDDSISEIMGNPDASWWYERDGIMRQEATISFHAGQLITTWNFLPFLLRRVGAVPGWVVSWLAIWLAAIAALGSVLLRLRSS